METRQKECWGTESSRIEIVYCAAVGCKNAKGGKVSVAGLSFHRYPLNNKKLLINGCTMGVENPSIPTHACVLYGTHFEKEWKVPFCHWSFGWLWTSDKIVSSSDSLLFVSLLPGLDFICGMTPEAETDRCHWPLEPAQLPYCILILPRTTICCGPFLTSSLVQCPQLVCMHTVTVPMTVAVHTPSQPGSQPPTHVIAATGPPRRRLEKLQTC